MSTTRPSRAEGPGNVIWHTITRVHGAGHNPHGVELSEVLEHDDGRPKDVANHSNLFFSLIAYLSLQKKINIGRQEIIVVFPLLHFYNGF